MLQLCPSCCYLQCAAQQLEHAAAHRMSALQLQTSHPLVMSTVQQAAKMGSHDRTQASLDVAGSCVCICCLPEHKAAMMPATFAGGTKIAHTSRLEHQEHYIHKCTAIHTPSYAGTGRGAPDQHNPAQQGRNTLKSITLDQRWSTTRRATAVGVSCCHALAQAPICPTWCQLSSALSAHGP